MIAFRPPVPADVEALAAVHLLCWRESYASLLTEAELAAHSIASRAGLWQEILTDDTTFKCLAIAEGSPVGFVVAGPARPPADRFGDGEIRALYLLRAWQRRGIGRDLFHKAAADWRRRSGQSLAMLVLAGNGPALAFYRSMGALEAGFARSDPASPDRAELVLVCPLVQAHAGPDPAPRTPPQ